jgi:hypothetical protein
MQTLELFTLTTPSLPTGLALKDKTNDKGAVTSIRVTLENRKAIATRLGITNNTENADKITAELLKLKDAVKTAGFGEMAKLATSPNWTGAAFSISTNKKGNKQKATFSLESVNRLGYTATPEQLEKAIASMTPEQVKALLEKAETLKRDMGAVVELKELPASELEDAGDKAQ